MNIFFNITIYSLLCLITGFVCLGLGVFVLSQNPTGNINKSYFSFCLGIFVWLFGTFLSSSKLFLPEYTVFFGKIVYTGVAFMPTLALHFAIDYLGPDCKSRAKGNLRITYLITFLFIILLWITPYFIVGVYQYSWGYFPKTGIIHYFHTFFVLVTAVYIIHLFWYAMKTIRLRLGKVKKYYEYRLILMAFVFVVLASSDFLHNWGVDFFPVGCIFVTLFVMCITYAIFKHKLLGISVVMQKSVIYSALLSIMVSVYFAVIYLVGTFVGGLAKAHSVPVILIILAIITALFRPLQQKIEKMIDNLFGKKPRETIEKENLHLLIELQKHDRMKAISTLAAGMAHEIKNPLTAIRTFAEYLPQKYDDPIFRDKFSRIVMDEVDRINNIVSQLLEFSKPAEPELKPITIGPLLDETLSLMNNNMLSHNIGLVRDLNPCPDIFADKNQLKQVFLNLFLNSIQSMKNGGRLTVSSRLQSDGYARISVSDTGCGMAKEQLSHLFDPFYTTREEGTGLGLAIVHSIIKKHGGKIEVLSEVGQGTTISVFLKSRD